MVSEFKSNRSKEWKEFIVIAICNLREHKIYLRPVISHLPDLLTLFSEIRVLEFQSGKELR